VTGRGDIRDANIAAHPRYLSIVYFQLPCISKVAALLGALSKQNSGNLHFRFGFYEAKPFSGLDELAEAHHDDRNPEKS